MSMQLQSYKSPICPEDSIPVNGDGNCDPEYRKMTTNENCCELKPIYEPSQMATFRNRKQPRLGFRTSNQEEFDRNKKIRNDRRSDIKNKIYNAKEEINKLNSNKKQIDREKLKELEDCEIEANKHFTRFVNDVKVRLSTELEDCKINVNNKYGFIFNNIDTQITRIRNYIIQCEKHQKNVEDEFLIQEQVEREMREKKEDNKDKAHEERDRLRYLKKSDKDKKSQADKEAKVVQNRLQEDEKRRLQEEAKEQRTLQNDEQRRLQEEANEKRTLQNVEAEKEHKKINVKSSGKTTVKSPSKSPSKLLSNSSGNFGNFGENNSLLGLLSGKFDIPNSNSSQTQLYNPGNPSNQDTYESSTNNASDPFDINTVVPSTPGMNSRSPRPLQGVRSRTPPRTSRRPLSTIQTSQTSQTSQTPQSPNLFNISKKRNRNRNNGTSPRSKKK